MLSIAVQTLRSRWVSFAGSFLALMLGVSLVSTMSLVFAATYQTPVGAPQRYAAAPALVRPLSTVRIPDRHGVASQTIGSPPPLPGALLTRLASTGKVVEDRIFYAEVTDGSGGKGPSVGRPWSAAATTPYELSAGHAPANDHEVVVSGGARPGAQVTVLTSSGGRTYTVSGVAMPRDGLAFETPVFFTDTEARRISPGVTAVAAYGSLAQVRNAVKGEAEVLTGTARRQADPDPDKDAKALNNTAIILGIAAGFAGFVAVFVVASTFAFGVAQRRREFALLRMIGSTPRQVRRMVFAEAALVGIVAGLVGTLFGPILARPLASWLIDHQLAPPWFTVPFSIWPLLLAFASGLVVAMFGVQAASWRASRVQPTEALREAVVDRKAMTLLRWLAGLGLLAGAFGTILNAAASAPVSATNRKTFVPIVMLLVAGFALLTPVIVGPVARLIAWPLERMGGATSMLVRENALTAVRRTASTAAPVLVAVGLAAAMLGASATIQATHQVELRGLLTADYLITPDGTSSLNQAVVDKVKAVPGVETTPLTDTTIYLKGDGSGAAEVGVQAADLAILPKMVNLSVLSGSLAHLTDDSIVLTEDSDHPVGERIPVWLDNGAQTTLRVAAVIKNGTSGTDGYIATALASGTLPNQLAVKIGSGADAAPLHAAVKGLGAKVESVRDWVNANTGKQQRNSRVGMQIVLGLSIGYCVLAIANTLTMATWARRREFALLRMTGATKRQVMLSLSAESLLVILVSLVLAASATMLCMAGLWVSLRQLQGGATVAIPYVTVAQITVVCAVAAVLATVIPARFSLRTPPIELTGAQE
jgi:putative ABC transport system permease protein